MIVITRFIRKAKITEQLSSETQFRPAPPSNIILLTYFRFALDGQKANR